MSDTRGYIKRTIGAQGEERVVYSDCETCGGDGWAYDCNDMVQTCWECEKRERREEEGKP